MAPLISVTFAGQNWLITPAALALNEAPPRNISDQLWMLVLSGVAITNDVSQKPTAQGIQGNNPHDWRRLTVTLFPDVSGPLTQAVTQFGIPKPQGNNILVFSLAQWAPFAAVSSWVDTTASPTGMAVDVWRPTHFTPINDVSGTPIANAFSGIDVDLAVFGNSVMNRVSYQITLLGKIRFAPNPIV